MSVREVMVKNLAYGLLAAFVIFAMFGCGDSEIPKKVNLNKRNHNNGQGNNIRQLDVGSLRFGFDLRLGPKEDVRIYLPFLRYLEQNTGNRFSLRFTEKYEDTVENLGKGITHFAALGPVNCIIANKKYGTGCLVMGLNSDGKPEYRAVIFTRMNSPIKSLKDLKGKTSRSYEFNLTDVYINSIIKHVIKLVEFQLKERAISLSLDLSRLPPIKADRAMIQQAILNLVLNAMCRH